MANQPDPARRSAASLSGRPHAFAHVKSLRPEFQQTASGAREQAQLKSKAPALQRAFRQAHEGPREALGKPQLRLHPTPHGAVVAAVHAKVDLEKRARNRQKDRQMKAWRERKVPQPSPAARPQRLLKKRSPDVLAGATKKRTVAEILQQKKSQSRSRSRGGRSR
jgi:hypothetical protein